MPELQPDRMMVAFVLGVLTILVVSRLLPMLRVRGRRMEPEEVCRLQQTGQDLLVLDVRTPEEFAQGHISGAWNLPLGELPARLKAAKDDLAAYREVPVVVVCRTENRSSAAFVQLERQGLANVRVLKGGMTGWSARNLPVKRRR